MKSWHATTLVPSSKPVCVLKCWDSSSNIIHLPNISLCHERNKVNERNSSQQVEGNYEIWKDDYVHKSQREEKPTNICNQNEEFAKVEFSKLEVICDEFYRFIFDPGGIQAMNSRLNYLEKGENDIILRSSPLTRIIKSFWNKRTELILVQSVIFVGYYMSVLFWIYLELWVSD